MQELQCFASEERMIPSAPIEDSQTITISAPIDRVWRIQTDVDHWANWYAYLRNAKLVGPFGPGGEAELWRISKAQSGDRESRQPASCDDLRNV